MIRYSSSHGLKSLRRTLAFLALCASSHSVWSEDLQEVYEAAVNFDPILGAAEAQLHATREAVPQTRSLLLPQVGVGGSTNWNERDFLAADAQQEFNSHGWQAQFRQPILDMSSWYTFSSARAAVDAAGHNFSATEQNLIVRATAAYLDVLRADALLEAATSNEEAVRQQLEQVTQRFDVGLVAITDVLEAQAVYDAATVTRIQAVGDHDIFFEVLRTLTGLPLNAIDSLSEEFPILNPEPRDVEEWVSLALATNFNVQAAESSLTSAERTIRARRSGHLPTIDGTISFSHSVTGGASFLGAKLDNTVYGLTLSLPVYQGGFVSSRTKEAQALAERSRELLSDSRLTVSRDTRNLFTRVSTDVVRVRARLKAIESSKSALEATTTGYDVGTRNIVEVLRAQNNLFSSEFDYADSRYNYVLGMVLLKQQAGVLNDGDLLDINNYTDPDAPIARLASLRARSTN